MRIACHLCKRIWEVPGGTSLSARLRFGLGQEEQTFVCPTCQTANTVSREEYATSDPQIPIVGKPAWNEGAVKPHPPRADNDPSSPPLNPVPGPDPSNDQVHAIVMGPELRLLREHNPMSETMGTLHKGEHIIILDSWADGKDTWIQLGPERWAIIEQDGEALVQLIDDPSRDNHPS